MACVVGREAGKGRGGRGKRLWAQDLTSSTLHPPLLSPCFLPLCQRVTGPNPPLNRSGDCSPEGEAVCLMTHGRQAAEIWGSQP